MMTETLSTIGYILSTSRPCPHRVSMQQTKSSSTTQSSGAAKSITYVDRIPSDAGEDFVKRGLCICNCEALSSEEIGRK